MSDTNELVDAHSYATRLLVSLMEKHYPDRHPDWSPLPDLMGVLTQIDNLSTGLVRAPVEAVPVDLLVAEMPDEDDIEEAISGSIDLDWTPRDAAQAVMRLLSEGVNEQGQNGEHLERCCPNDPNNDPKNENIDASTFNLVLSALTDLERYLRDTPHHNSTQAAAARYAINKAGGWRNG